MSNETLLATLEETRGEIVEERGRRIGRIQQRNDAVMSAKVNLQRAKNQESAAVQKDETLKASQRELIDHLNGLTSKPQALLEKVERLGTEQLSAFRERRQAAEVVRQVQRELAEAEMQMTAANMDLQASDRDVAEIDAQIRQVRGY